jgi:hypothetical protein
MKIAKLSVVAFSLLSTLGCASKINSFTVNTVLDRATDRPDIDRVCAVGEALGIPLMSLTSKKHYPKKALIVAEVSAAICAEMEAREHALDIALAKKNLPPGAGKIGTIKDARVRESRARQLAALRYYAAFQYLEEQWGEAGGSCPTIKEKDEVAYFLGLHAGLMGTLHDSASGRQIGVPQGTLGKVARATQCIDNQRWWNGPGAFQAAIWATLGGEPEGIDPWELIEDQARKGEKTGVRIGWATLALIASNAGKEDLTERAITEFARALETKPDANWAALDEYSMMITRHESDLIWIAAEGHRTETFGELPQADVPVSPSEDGESPFGDEDNPFGEDDEDPFSDDAEDGGGNPTPEENQP